jgi:hypothetical protein
VAKPAFDLFAATAARQNDAAAAPAEVLAGLDILAARRPPLWPVAPDRWLNIVDAVRSFAERWHAAARACGWSDLELYGLHRRAPYANLAAMGAAWLIAKSGHAVVEMNRDAITVVTVSSSRLRLYRRPIDADARLPWAC